MDGFKIWGGLTALPGTRSCREAAYRSAMLLDTEAQFRGQY